MTSELTSPAVGDNLYRDLKKLIANLDADEKLASERRLSRKYGIAASTVRRVFDRFESEGLVYRVHGKGTFVAKGKSDRQDSRITIVFADQIHLTGHKFFSRRLEGITHQAARQKARLHLLPCSPYPVGGHEALLDAISADDVEGLIFPWIGDDLYREVIAIKPKLKIIGCASHLCKQNLTSVGVDQIAMGMQAWKYLSARGTNHIAVISTDHEFIAGVKQAACPRTGTCKHHLSIRLVEDDCDGKSIAAWLKENKADGVACNDDRLTMKARNAIAEGDDLLDMAWISHANAGEKLLPPKIARLEVDGYDVGQTLVQVIMAMIRDNILTGTDVRLHPRLVVPHDAT